MTIFSLFFVELMAMRFAIFATPANLTLPNPENGHSHGHDLALQSVQRRASQHQPGEDHLSHTKDHIDNEDAVLGTENNSSLEKNNIDRVDSIAAMPTGNLQDIEDYRAQLTAILILEFGVIFHSIFIGLTLAVAGDEFNTLYIVLVFHQTFEGLGLGSRLAVTPWPKNHLYTPYLFGVAYAFSTPIAIAIGLGVRTTYAPGSNTALIVNGVFDSISAGILIYTGLVELMAHEFMFSSSMRRASIKVVLFAVLVMCLGAGLMALLGKWA